MNYNDNVLNDLFPFMLLFFDSRLTEDDAFVRIDVYQLEMDTDRKFYGLMVIELIVLLSLYHPFSDMPLLGRL